MSDIMIDVESDGQCPGIFSMLEIGAIAIKKNIDFINKNKETLMFHRKLKPISENYEDYILSDVLGYTREETKKFDEPFDVICDFNDFLSKFKKPLIFISDNNGFDYQFINYYFIKYIGKNPFGHSSINLNSLFKGLNKNMFVNFKKLRKTKHDHNPINDALGNIEALFEMKKQYGLKINIK